jgi:restriction system protein
MEEREEVYLDSVDGFEFERICQRILERIHKCNVEDTVPVGDEGRDLLIHSPRGLIVVECKHHPNSSIGRPVVQKLHSAVVSSNAKNGILITTGTFSKAAYEYAEKLRKMGVVIDLVDRAVLADMASKAGMMIVVDGQRVPVWTYDVSDKDRIEKMIADYLDRLYVSHPMKPSQLVKIHERDIDLIPIYEVRYGINAVFETNAGIIHQETLPDGRFFVDGERGSVLKPELTKFFSPLPIKLYPVNSMNEWNPNLRAFSVGTSQVKEIASSEIIRRHTRNNVGYTGRNNQSYVKTCVPNSRQFTITSIRQLYIPVNASRIQVLEKLYDLQYLEHPSGELRILNDDLRICGICGRSVPGNPILCNTCGTPVHPKSLFSAHSFRCGDCNKTLCRSCTVFVRKHLLFKHNLCRDCMSKYSSDKVRKYSSVS